MQGACDWIAVRLYFYLGQFILENLVHDLFDHHYVSMLKLKEKKKRKCTR